MQRVVLKSALALVAVESALALGQTLAGSTAIPPTEKVQEFLSAVAEAGTRGNTPTSTASTTATEHPRLVPTSDGFLRAFIAPPGRPIPTSLAATAPPLSAALAFISDHGPAFGLVQHLQQLRPIKLKTLAGHHYARFEQQLVGGFPVFGAEVVVQLDNENRVSSVLADVLTSSALEAAPPIPIPLPIDEGAALVIGARELGHEGDPELRVGAPRLCLFAPTILGEAGAMVWAWDVPFSHPTTRAWNLRLLVDATTGVVFRLYPLHYSVLNRQISDANNTTAIPGNLARAEGQLPTGILDVDDSYDFLGDTYGFYDNHHNRDSYDGSGAPLDATVRLCVNGQQCPWPNAYWSSGRTHFGTGWAVDDVVAHELTHGVTESESGLIYANTSGAINESFSDIWGEFVDLANGAGNDAPVVRWLVGEDLAIGAIRHMGNPPAFGDPDRLGSPLYVPPTNNPDDTNDYGGVHTNSGVSNRLCSLLTDGGTFNGWTITAIGIDATASLFYDANVNMLTPGADWTDLFVALQNAAQPWSDEERNNIFRACAAVEINPPSVFPIYVNGASSCPYQTGATVCAPQVFSGPFRTVTQAVEAVSPGGLIQIESGNYPESLVIQKIATVVAVGGPVTIGP